MKILFLLLLFFPAITHAIPSPTSLILLSNLWSFVFAGAAIPFLYTLFKRDKKNYSPYILFILITLIGLLYFNNNQENQHIQKLTSEFQCDVGFHAYREKIKYTQQDWDKSIIKRFIRFDDFKKQIGNAKKSLIIDLRLPFWVDFGKVTIDNLKVKQVYPSELKDYLSKYANDQDSKIFVFIITHRPTYLMQIPEGDRAQIENMLVHGFDSAFTFAIKDDVWGALNNISVTSDKGIERKAIYTTDARDFKFVNENFLIDSYKPVFENFYNYLSAPKIKNYLNDDDVYIIVPFLGTYREDHSYIQMVEEWIPHKKLNDKILPLDFSDEDIRKQMNKVMNEIKGSPFICAGVGKFDCLYFGNNFVHEFHKANKKVNYLGYTADLPHAAAINAWEQSNLQKNYYHQFKNYISENLNDIAENYQLDFKVSHELSVLLSSILFSFFLISILAFNFRKDILYFVYLRLRMSSPSWRDQYAYLRSFYHGKTQLILSIFFRYTPLFLMWSLILKRDLFIYTAKYHYFLATWTCLTLLMVINLYLNLTLREKNVTLFKTLGGAALCLFLIYLLNVPLENLIFLCGALIPLNLYFFVLRKLVFEKESKLEIPLFEYDKKNKSQPKEGIFDILLDDFPPQYLKARNLKILNQMSLDFIRILPGIVICGKTSDDDFFVSLKNKLHTEFFLYQYDDFIVRSNSSSEDVKGQSKAGQYHSELEVNSEEIMSAILKVRESFRELKDENFSVIIQPMMYFDYAGMALSSNPQNKSHTTIEYTKGNPNNIISNNQKSDCYKISKITGQALSTIPLSYEKDLIHLTGAFSLINKLVLFLDISIKDFFEIEWGVSKTENQLYILQLRTLDLKVEEKKPVAEFNKYLRERVHELKNINLNIPVWKKTTEVGMNSLSFLSKLVYKEIYKDKGPIYNAYNHLKTPLYTNNALPFMEFINGHLYEVIAKKRNILILYLLQPYYRWRVTKNLSKHNNFILKCLKRGVFFNKIHFTDHKQWERAFDLFLKYSYTGYFISKHMARMQKNVNKARNKSPGYYFVKELSGKKISDSDLFKKWGHRTGQIFEISKCPTLEELKGVRKIFEEMENNNKQYEQPSSRINEYSYYCEVFHDLLLKFLFKLKVLIKNDKSIELEKEVLKEKYPLFDIKLEFKNDSFTLLDLEKEIHRIEEKPLIKGRVQFISGERELKGQLVRGAISLSSEVNDRIFLTESLGSKDYTLFPKFKGVIAKSCNELSHIAVLARELNYPLLVVGEKNYLQLKKKSHIQVLPSGDYLCT